MASAPKRRTTKAKPADPNRSFGYLTVRLRDQIMERAEATLAPFGLKPRELDALICIQNCHGMSQQELSQKLGLYAPRMVDLIDGLQKRSIVERQVSETDRRRHALSLTPQGRELLQRAERAAVQMDMELFGCIPERDRQRFEDLVLRIEATPSPKGTSEK